MLLMCLFVLRLPTGVKSVSGISRRNYIIIVIQYFIPKVQSHRPQVKVLIVVSHGHRTCAIPLATFNMQV